jgi:hypothetical protein
LSSYTVACCVQFDPYSGRERLLQVELYAEYAPGELLPFLQSSKAYHADKALAVCKRHDLVREQVRTLHHALREALSGGTLF